MVTLKNATACLTAALTLSSLSAHADSYVRGYVNASFLADDNAAINGMTGPALLDAEFDLGFGAGAAFGRVFGDRLRAEIDYTYTSNGIDSSELGAGVSASGDNYASTALGVNLLYHFRGDPRGQDGWSLYGGVGLVWLNEIDIDLEGDGVGGDFEDLEGDDMAPRLLLGAQRTVGERWTGGFEVRYLPVGGVKLTNDSARIEGLSYDNWSVGATLSYWFD